jgi:NADH-quinone oxidoreductase subunit L
VTYLLAAESAPAAVNEVVQTTTGAIGLAWLIPVIPLLGFVAVLLLTRTLRAASAFVAIGAAAVSFLLSIAVFLQVSGDPATHIRPMPTWISAGDLEVTFDLQVDQLTVVMLLVVTGVGLLVHLYSLGYMHGDARYERFFAYLNLFLASMLILVLGANLLTLFLGWELVGLSSYLLIGFWFEKREYAAAAKKAFITNRVGDVSFMVAMFLAFATFGTLTFTEMLPEAGTLSPTVATVLVLLLLGGAAAKSAQIPLHVWLPDAMAGPTPVSALIHAATMVTAGVYLTVRMSPVLVQSLDAMEVIGWIGALTALTAALIALRQDDIKKILAYSTVSQLGYMFLAVGVGAFREGVFHLVTHAFFKGLLFLAAGSVMHAMANRTDAWGMGGLRKLMPITFWTSLIGWLAISGLPPFAGFFSKDQILTEVYVHGYLPLYLIGLVTAVITAFYMSRWFFLIFLGEPRWRAAHAPAAAAAGAGGATRADLATGPSAGVGGATRADLASGPTATGHDGGRGGDVPPAHTGGGVPSSQDAPVAGLHPHESPLSMTIPLIVLAVLSAVAGALLNFQHRGPFNTFLGPISAPIDDLGYQPAGPLEEPALIAISIVAAAFGIGLAYLAYVRRDVSQGRMVEPIRGTIAEVFERKFFFDDLYEATFVRFGGWVAGRLEWFDRRVLDGAVDGLGGASMRIGEFSRRAQTGLVRGYVAGLVVGALALVAVVLIQVR